MHGLDVDGGTSLARDKSRNVQSLPREADRLAPLRRFPDHAPLLGHNFAARVLHEVVPLQTA